MATKAIHNRTDAIRKQVGIIERMLLVGHMEETIPQRYPYANTTRSVETVLSNLREDIDDLHDYIKKAYKKGELK